MKTVVGFVCGTIGLVCSVLLFLSGAIVGFKVGVSDKTKVTKDNSGDNVFNWRDDK